MPYILVAFLIFPHLTSVSPNFTEVTKLIEQQFHLPDAEESILTTLKFDIDHEGHKLSFETPISIKGFSSNKTATLLYPQVIQGFEDNWHSMQLMFNFGKANFTSEVSYQQMLKAEDFKNPKELPSSQRMKFNVTAIPVKDLEFNVAVIIESNEMIVKGSFVRARLVWFSYETESNESWTNKFLDQLHNRLVSGEILSQVSQLIKKTLINMSYKPK